MRPLPLRVKGAANFAQGIFVIWCPAHHCGKYSTMVSSTSPTSSIKTSISSSSIGSSSAGGRSRLGGIVRGWVDRLHGSSHITSAIDSAFRQQAAPAPLRLAERSAGQLQVIPARRACFTPMAGLSLSSSSKLSSDNSSPANDRFFRGFYLWQRFDVIQIATEIDQLKKLSRRLVEAVESKSANSALKSSVNQAQRFIDQRLRADFGLGLSPTHPYRAADQPMARRFLQACRCGQESTAFL